MSNSSFYSNTGITSADVSSITSAKEAAATSETNAATSATNAATSSTNAATSATNAATSETNASNSAATATTSAANASTSETNASASAATATTQASNAATSATAAAGSASTAGTSATNAASSATNAATSETNAATSETNAANSATSAATSATNAGTSETNAAASASSASGYVTSATTQANNAASSATAAATSETNAASSATAASTSASGASTSASNANTSATNAASSASQAATSAAAAALAADNFDDTYLGSNASDPTTDNDGDALNAGDLHFNTTSNTLKVYNGSAWQDAAIDSSGFVQTTGDTMTGVLAFVSGQTFDGRDVSADGTKLDTIETNADVTDTANVTAAGALMDSELTNIAAVKALNQGLATTDEPSFSNTTLNAIAATISDTAVDIFVYDTRKDSDGGAWRKRTQHTSWYNEGSGTYRGTRKEFPAVAVIVATSSQVTIYDGDDPDLPMWIKFNGNTNHSIFLGFSTNGNVSSLFMLDGKLSIGTTGSTTNGSVNAVQVADFATDTLEKWDEIGYMMSPQVIADRNDQSWGGGLGWYQTSSKDTSKKIVNQYVNDVAMTVLPNAPIDAATGLPVPTIAVATAGGTSVIRDDGTVVDVMAGTNAFGVEFTKDHKLLHTANDANSTFSIHVRSIPSSDTTSFASRKYNHDGSGGFTTPPISGISNESTSKKLAILPNHTIASATLGSSTTGGKPALNLLQEVPNAPTTGKVAYVTSDYNTGYQVGDIKLATLSDTDATNVTGTNLVSNGTFDSNIDGWASNGAAVSWHSSGRLQLVSSGGNQPAYASITCEVGKRYYVELDFEGSWSFHVGTGASAANDVANIPHEGNTGVVTRGVFFTATQTTHYLVPYVIGAATAYVDNVSVTLAEDDRSVNGGRNGNGLQVFGTVTKSAVETGADLVAYSGFSTSNYLQQPYNSGLDFGTGDWCYMWWQKMDSVTNGMSVFGRDAIGEGGTSAGRIGCYFNADKLRVDLTDDGASSYTGKLSSQSVIGLTGWNCFVIIRRGSNFEFYINGKFDSSVALGSTGDGSYTNTSATLNIGYDINVANALSSGALALFRASATAPSPEQIAKIYEDEKRLFQENAQATLYGSSDAVTALAYDDSTNLLHVGTSAGRSVFQGLRRVDNTTTAVGAAISASNGLVADE